MGRGFLEIREVGLNGRVVITAADITIRIRGCINTALKP
jgi:hypothetical protein